MKRGKKVFSFFMVLAMLVFCLPMQVFAEEIGESRLFSVDFSPRVDMNREFNPDVYTYTTSVNTSEKSIAVTPYAMDSNTTIRVNGTVVTNGTPSLPISLDHEITLITIEVQSIDVPSNVKTYVFSVKKTINLDDAGLKSIVVEGATLDHPFSTEKSYYTGRVEATQSYVSVKTTAFNSAITKINGNLVSSSGSLVVEMKTGINTIFVEMTSLNGASKSYTFVLTKSEANNNANIRSILINGKYFAENGSVFVDYVSSNATNLNVVINPSDNFSSINMDGKYVTVGSSTNLNLRQESINVFPIVITAANGITTKTYNLHIIRLGTSNSTTGDVNNNAASGTSYAGNTSLTVDSKGDVVVTDGAGATTTLSRQGSGRLHSVNLDTQAIQKILRSNSKVSEIVVDYSKKTGLNDSLNLNIDSTLTKLLQDRKVKVKLMSINGYATVDLTLLRDWNNGGSITISRANIGVSYEDEYIPASGFIRFEYTGGPLGVYNPLDIEIPIYSDADVKLANVYRFDENSGFTLIPSTTEEKVKRSKGVSDGDFIVMNFKKSFTDIKNHWSFKLLDFMSKKQVISGYPDDSFRPDRYVTRAEFTSMLIKAISEHLDTVNVGEEPFSDVNTNDWYYAVVDEGWKAALITGITSDSFGPNQNITREQMAAIAVRALNQLKTLPDMTSTQANSILGKYNDSKVVSSWAKVDLATAIDQKIIDGIGNNKLASKDLATRAQAAVIVYKVLNESIGF
ncbi:S-layer homology domain-containing protein [Paenibacillus sp. CF095]|uniref:S-layer homology domain-containing protein n=1 Tax=Paenibacillus sp. CF095 TaxID=1881033 RepID=UPI00088F3199|nr:S-layer homology domain-containing protein [Paenibacillus sp. CF095]SDD51633.1 S-layer homology domain-containing protein [Paenibacillus sp. CF095]